MDDLVFCFTLDLVLPVLLVFSLQLVPVEFDGGLGIEIAVGASIKIDG